MKYDATLFSEMKSEHATNKMAGNRSTLTLNDLRLNWSESKLNRLNFSNTRLVLGNSLYTSNSNSYLRVHFLCTEHQHQSVGIFYMDGQVRFRLVGVAHIQVNTVETCKFL